MSLLTRLTQNKPLTIGVGVSALVLLVLVIALPIALQDNDSKATPAEIVARVLSRVPLIDGHNDFPLVMRMAIKNQLEKANFSQTLKGIKEWDDTGLNQADIPRLRKGKVGAQFWATWVDCRQQYNNSLHMALEQIDVTKRMVEMYPNDFEFVTTAQGIRDAFDRGKIGSLIGIEGGHMMEESLAALRTLYEVGARYMTLTHNCDTPWSHYHVEPTNETNRVGDGLTEFGEKVIHEMNRIGMMVDLSHVHENTMRRVLNVTKAPVIFSHSSARAVCNVTRNVPDDVLEMTVDNGGIVMVNFYTHFVNCSLPENQTGTIQDVVAHFNHMKTVMGSADHIGIGADYCGVDVLPVGLEDVSTYPAFLEALLQDEEAGWTESDLRKIVGENMLRVMEQVEAVSKQLRSTNRAADDLIPAKDVPELTCGLSDLLEEEPEETSGRVLNRR